MIRYCGFPVASLDAWGTNSLDYSPEASNILKFLDYLLRKGSIVALFAYVSFGSKAEAEAQSERYGHIFSLLFAAIVFLRFHGLSISCV